MMAIQSKHPSSFRDPSGFVFERDGVLYRQINRSYREDFDTLLHSGLYETLVQQRLLIPHEEVDIEPFDPATVYKLIKPEPIPFLSFPYEWCFSTLKDAALTTLRIQRLSLKHGMILKDASAFNIQILQGKPILIDSLSFQRWVEGRPWDGYRQFCQHFLAPLALMAHKDIRLSKLLTSFLDGLPLDLASHILPIKTMGNFSLLTHIHLHSRLQKRAAKDVPQQVNLSPRKVTMNSLLGMTDDLQRAIKGLKWDPETTRWADYYETFSYTDESVSAKEALVESFIRKAKPNCIWDIGANTGHFSRIASGQGIFTVSMDFDPGAVEINYQKVTEQGEELVLPLVIDLMNPTPSLGWQLRERESILDRSPVDAIMALALTHHLAIGNNLPFSEIAGFFARLCQWLLIEFIPKDDIQVQRMLSVREDIFDLYQIDHFEEAFQAFFEIIEQTTLEGSSRVFYIMKKRAGS
jgi:hypothetical protein